MNTEADAISRLKYRASATDPEYFMGPALKLFFRTFLSKPVHDVLQIAALIRTALDSGGSSHFLRC
jgi:hypothetical protein